MDEFPCPELVVGVETGKARQVRLLGFEPVVAVSVNLVYSAVGFALFCWLATAACGRARPPRR